MPPQELTRFVLSPCLSGKSVFRLGVDAAIAAVLTSAAIAAKKMRLFMALGAFSELGLTHILNSKSGAVRLGSNLYGGWFERY